MFGSKKKQETEYQRIMQKAEHEKNIALAYINQLRRKDQKYNFHLIPLACINNSKYMPMSSYGGDITFVAIYINGQRVKIFHNDQLSLSLKPGKYKLQLDIKVNRQLSIEEYSNLKKVRPDIEARVKGQTLEYTCTRTCDFVVNDAEDCYVLFKLTVSSHWQRYYDQEELDGTSFSDYRVHRYNLSKLVEYRHSYEAYQTSAGVLEGLCHYWDVDPVLYDYPIIEQQYVDECMETYGVELSRYVDERLGTGSTEFSRYVDECLRTSGAESSRYEDVEKKPTATTAPPPKATAPKVESATPSVSTSVKSTVPVEPRRTVAPEPRPPKTTVVPPREAPKKEPTPTVAKSNEHTLPCGDKFIGSLKDGKCDGKGEYYYKNGDVYFGEFRNGVKEGSGRLFYHQKGRDGDRYEGSFHRDMRHGKGEYHYKNGDRYVGEFYNDEMTGKGKLYFACGDVYEGSFQNGKFHGDGVITYSGVLKVFEGKFRYGKRHGRGSFIISLTNRYECEYQNDEPVGEYECHLGTRYVYVGDLKDFKYHGKGRLTDNLLDVEYEGEFRDGLFDGRGVYNTGSGRYEGDFQKGEYHGFGIEYDKDNNKVYEGYFQNGKRHGKGKEFGNDHGYEGDFVCGKCEGYGHYWIDDHKYEGEFKNDSPHGRGKWIFSDKSSLEGTFVDGKCHGKGVYTYPNGDRYEGDYVDNAGTGRGVCYFMNGNRYEGEFKSRKFHGQGIFYYVNGNRLVGTCVEGKWHGKALLYYINGEIEEQIYDQDVLVEKKVLTERSPSKLYRFNTAKGLNIQNGYYIGEVIHDIPNGFGYWLYPNGDAFIGQFQNGQCCGFGLYFAIDSHCVYAGQFLDFNLNGYGVAVRSDRSATFGVFENGTMKETVGSAENPTYQFIAERMTYNLQLCDLNGAIYLGPVLNGYLHYAGVMCFASDVKYIGQYENGYTKGFGIYLYPDGSFYIGMFDNNQFNGYGMMVKKDSCKFGRWENNLFIG